MKISKLFHWCYAFLMFLPICAIGVKSGYVMLNKNAKDSYSGSYQYLSTTKYSNYITNKLLSYTSYTNNTYTNDYISSTAFNNINVINPRGTLFTDSVSLIGVNTNSILINGTEINNIKSVVFGYSDRDLFYYACYDYVLDTNYFINRANYSNIQLFYDTTLLQPLNTRLINISSNSIDFSCNLLTNTIYCTNNRHGIFENSYLDIFINDLTLSSVFYSALQELDKVSFFSWAKDSFLAQPFMYIGNLFGIPNVHPIFTFLSYWCAISIIWLVFDLFMYMPLLVHKWIDKAKVE